MSQQTQTYKSPPEIAKTNILQVVVQKIKEIFCGIAK